MVSLNYFYKKEDWFNGAQSKREKGRKVNQPFQHSLQWMLCEWIDWFLFFPERNQQLIQKSFDQLMEEQGNLSSISSLSLFLMAQCGPTKQRWDEWACRGNLSCLGAPLVCLLSAPSTIFSISLQRKLTAAKTNCATFISFNSTNCFHFVQSIVSLGLLSWLCLLFLAEPLAVPPPITHQSSKSQSKPQPPLNQLKELVGCAGSTFIK